MWNFRNKSACSGLGLPETRVRSADTAIAIFPESFTQKRETRKFLWLTSRVSAYFQFIGEWNSRKEDIRPETCLEKIPIKMKKKIKKVNWREKAKKDEKFWPQNRENYLMETGRWIKAQHPVTLNRNNLEDSGILPGINCPPPFICSSLFSSLSPPLSSFILSSAFSLFQRSDWSWPLRWAYFKTEKENDSFKLTF